MFDLGRGKAGKGHGQGGRIFSFLTFKIPHLFVARRFRDVNVGPHIISLTDSSRDRSICCFDGFLLSQ